MQFSIIHTLFDTALEALLWIFFWYVAIWNWMDGIMNTFALCNETPWKNDILQAYLFSVFVTLIEIFLNLPFSLYGTFVIEEKYGFNKTTPGTFICDEIKKFVLILVIYAVIIPLLLWLIAVSGPALILTLASVSVVIVILVSLLIPTVIVPLFYTYTDLEDGELKTAILKEAEKTDVKVAEIKVIDGSKRSSHSNAFVSGFWNFRKVVLFDTLIA
jgi:STE24 endopeptidase